MALLDKPTINPQAPLSEDVAKQFISAEGPGDDAVLQLVIQDSIRAENFELQKRWLLAWTSATTLYQSPFTSRYWEGTQTERANIPFFTLATCVNSLVPQVINGLFTDNPPFMVQKRPRTSALAADAVRDLLAYQLEDINAREELRLGTTNAVLFGTGIWKWGWESYEREVKRYERKRARIQLKSPLTGQAEKLHDTDEDIEEVTDTEYVDRPTLEHMVNLQHVLVDPGCNRPDIRKAKYVVHRMYMTLDDLDKLRDRPGYKIPSRDKLVMLFVSPKEPVEETPAENQIRNPLWDARAEVRYEATTFDPTQQPLEVLERWDGKRVSVVLQKKLVICNDENPYGKIPFLSVGWWDVPEAFWSMGLAKTIGAEQRLQQGITNLWLDNAALNLNGVYVRVKGKSVPTQSIRIAPGKIVEVDNKDDFKVLDRLPAVPEAGQHLQLSQARTEQVSGASEFATQGVAGSSGHSNLARSATGANLMASGTGSRTGDFIEKLSNQVLVPFLYEVHEMNRSLMPVETLQHILNDELEHEFLKNGGDILEILNARVSFQILAGAKMTARRNMAQALPIMIQFLTSEQVMQQLAIQKKKVNVAELLRMMFEVSDWKTYEDVVQDMSDEDEKRWQMTTPAAQQQSKFQSQSALLKQQGDQKASLSQDENVARAAREVLRSAFEQAATPEEVTGEPGGRAFGANV